MSSTVEIASRIEHLGKALPDEDMPFWSTDTELVKQARFDWSQQDLSFDWIVEALIQKDLYAMTHGGEYIIEENTPISNQGRLGSCVANAVMDALEMVMPVPVQLSRLFAYWVSQALHGDTRKDSGTYNRACFHQAMVIGLVPEEHYPYIDTLEAATKNPELDLFTMASNNKLKQVYRIVKTGSDLVDQIEIAIRTNHPVVFAMDVNKEFTRYRGGGHVWNDMPNTIGGHAMVLTGVRRNTDKREFLDRNSWGVGWGDEGHCWMTEELIREQARDIWVGTQLEELI